jgi:hypothetical protein
VRYGVYTSPTQDIGRLDSKNCPLKSPRRDESEIRLPSSGLDLTELTGLAGYPRLINIPMSPLVSSRWSRSPFNMTSSMSDFLIGKGTRNDEGEQNLYNMIMWHRYIIWYLSCYENEKLDRSIDEVMHCNNHAEAKRLGEPVANGESLDRPCRASTTCQYFHISPGSLELFSMVQGTDNGMFYFVLPTGCCMFSTACSLSAYGVLLTACCMSHPARQSGVLPPPIKRQSPLFLWPRSLNFEYLYFSIQGNESSRTNLAMSLSLNFK